MVLTFPILADYAILPLTNGGLAYLTHGHRYNEETPPPMTAQDILLHGHTHVAGKTTCVGGHPCLNPGSVSMPKGNTPACYIILEGDTFEIKRLEDKSVWMNVKI